MKKSSLAVPDPLEPPLVVDPPAGRLLAAARADALHGARLLHGEEGIGKLRFALELARLLDCTAEPRCESARCDSCRRIVTGVHPDVAVVRPEDGGVIKVEPIRRIVATSQLRPYEARTRVVILDQAETLHLSAANALLKTLEEPPPHLAFILVTSRLEDVLPTIRSRAPAHHVPTPSPEAARAFLSELGWPSAEVAMATATFGGRVGCALRGLHRELEGSRRRMLEGLGNPAARLALATELAAAEPLEEVVRVAAELLRDVAVSGDHGAPLRHGDLGDEIRAVAEAIPAEAAIELAKELLRVPARRRTNPNLRLLFEDLILGMEARSGRAV